MTGPDARRRGLCGHAFQDAREVGRKATRPAASPPSKEGPGPVSSGGDALERGLDEPVDDLYLSLVLARSRLERGVVDPELVVGTRAVAQDLARPLELSEGAEVPCVVGRPRRTAPLHAGCAGQA
jgi:hypothetical protein